MDGKYQAGCVGAIELSSQEICDIGIGDLDILFYESFCAANINAQDSFGTVTEHLSQGKATSFEF